MSIEDGPLYATAIAGVRALLTLAGDDPDREGLARTPERVVAAMLELTRGLREPDPDAVLDVQFASGYDQAVLLRGVPFTSLCEHHLLPFTGTATLAYLPANGRVVGLSKLARLLDGYARRPQIQEGLTQQLAEAMERRLRPLGVAVLISAEHTCLTCRGVLKPGAVMTTSVLRGVFREDPAARAELLALAGGAG